MLRAIFLFGFGSDVSYGGPIPVGLCAVILLCFFLLPMLSPSPPISCQSWALLPDHLQNLQRPARACLAFAAETQPESSRVGGVLAPHWLTSQPSRHRRMVPPFPAGSVWLLRISFVDLICRSTPHIGLYSCVHLIPTCVTCGK